MEIPSILVCFCKKTFEQKQEYINHAKDCFKGIKDKNLQIVCAICNKTISSAGYFTKIHLNFHEDVKQLPCNITGCNSRFTVRADLIAHQRKKHTFEKPVQCQNCGICFATSRERSSHMRIHESIKFGCTICQKTFARKFVLKAHMRTHTGERPYQCKTCGKQFTQQSSLNKHERTHSK